MTTSLPQQDYLTISSSSDSTVTVAVPDLDIVTLDINNMSSSATIPTYSYSSGYLSSDTVTLSNIDLSGINWEGLSKEEFVNCFPDFTKVKDMCEEYPGLKIALKKFQEVYTIVEDDWNAQRSQKYVP